MCGAACESRAGTRVVLEADDLIARLPSAEQRSARALEDSIRVEAAGPAEDRRVALVTVAPSRILWTGPLPPRAWIETSLLLAAGSGATARIGISDNRLYEELARIEVRASGAAAWRDVRVDLGRYSGWQWSVFYRPSEIEWRLIFNADATPEGTIAWARPMIKRER
jgi:hypothetical protein